jgi:hypothetical protein
MHALVDWYKDIPHIKDVFSSSTPWCCCSTLGVIFCVKFDKTNFVEQG